MKEEIKKKIEEYLKGTYYDFEGTDFWAKDSEGYLQKVADLRGWGAIQNMFKTEEEAANFQDAVGEFIAEAIREKLNPAQQSVNSELYSEIERLIISWNIDATSTAGTLARKIINVLSSSQNQQNEKSAPSQVVEEAMRVTQKHVRVPNAIRNGEVLSPQQNEKESDAVEEMKAKRIDWNQLREEFFSEHVQKDTGGFIHITTAAHDLFEWFKNKIENNK